MCLNTCLPSPSFGFARFPWLCPGLFARLRLGRFPRPLSGGLFGRGLPRLLWVCFGRLVWSWSRLASIVLGFLANRLGRRGVAGSQTRARARGDCGADPCGSGVGSAGSEGKRKRGISFCDKTHKAARFSSESRTALFNAVPDYLRTPASWPFSRLLTQSGLKAPILSALVQFTATDRPLAASLRAGWAGSNKLFRPAEPDHPTPPPEKAGGRL